MIFDITEELVMADDKNFIKSLENIFLGFIEGAHLIYMKPKVYYSILKRYDNQIDERLRNHLISFEENFLMESKLILKYVTDIIRIIPSFGEEKIEKEEHYFVRNLSTSRFLSSSKIQKCTLLGENEDDSYIYEIMANEYKKFNNISELISIELTPENGGGNTTTDVFKNKISRDNEICLCILDSDKKFPTDEGLGETANRIKREVKKIENPKFFYYIEKRCRELENMLPITFYKDVYMKFAEKSIIFPKLEQMNNLNEKLIYFFDLKKGLKHHTFKCEKDWQVLTHLVDDSKIGCKTSLCTKKDTCRYLIIECFGKDILKDFRKYYEEKNNSFSALLKETDSIIQSIWHDLGKLIFSWTCGFKNNYMNT